MSGPVDVHAVVEQRGARKGDALAAAAGQPDVEAARVPGRGEGRQRGRTLPHGDVVAVAREASAAVAV